MKKGILSAGLMALALLIGSFNAKPAQATVDTVVVGQGYYGGGGGYGGYYGGYGYGGGYYGGGNPNPAYQAVAASPYFLGAVANHGGHNGGRNFRGNNVLYAPNINNGYYGGGYGGYGQGYGAGYDNGGGGGDDPNSFNGPLVNYHDGVYSY